MIICRRSLTANFNLLRAQIGNYIIWIHQSQAFWLSLQACNDEFIWRTWLFYNIFFYPISENCILIGDKPLDIFLVRNLQKILLHLSLWMGSCAFALALWKCSSWAGKSFRNVNFWRLPEIAAGGPPTLSRRRRVLRTNLPAFLNWFRRLRVFTFWDMIHRLFAICDLSAHNSASFHRADNGAVLLQFSQTCDWLLIWAKWSSAEEA